MLYTHDSKYTFRLPYDSTFTLSNYYKLSEIKLDLKINFHEPNKLKLLSLKTFSLDKLKNGIPIKVQSSEQDVTSGEALSGTVIVVASESVMSFYHSSNQSLEVQNFSPYFKAVIHEATKRILVFENKGTDTVTIHSVNFSQSFFSCQNKIFPVILEEGEQKKIEVSFLPRQRGLFNCELSIKTSVLNHTEILYPLTGSGRYSQSYYKIINGIRYDRELFDRAHDLLYRYPQNEFSLEDAKHLVLFATDAHYFTAAEKNTFNYVANTFNCSDDSKQWLTDDSLMRKTRLSNYQISLYNLSTKDLLGNLYALSLKEIAKNEFNLQDIEISVLEEEAKNKFLILKIISRCKMLSKKV